MYDMHGTDCYSCSLQTLYAMSRVLSHLQRDHGARECIPGDVDVLYAYLPLSPLGSPVRTPSHYPDSSASYLGLPLLLNPVFLGTFDFYLIMYLIYLSPSFGA